MKELLVSLIKNIEVGKITAMGVNHKTNTLILLEHAPCVIKMGEKTFFINQSTSHAITRFKVDNVIMYNLQIGSENKNNIIRYLNPIVISNKNAIKDAVFYDNFRVTFEKGSEFAEKSFNISEEQIRWEFFKALLLYLNLSKVDLFLYNQNWGNILYEAKIEVEPYNEFLNAMANEKADISLGETPYKIVQENFLNRIKEIPTSFSMDIMNKKTEIIENQSKDKFANYILNNKIYSKDDEKFIENIKELYNFLDSNEFNRMIETDKGILDKYKTIKKSSSDHEEEEKEFNEYEDNTGQKRKSNIDIYRLEKNVRTDEEKMDTWDDVITEFFKQ